MLAIGLMSGTSLDGVDASLVEIKGLFKKQFILKDFVFIPYTEAFKQKILRNSKIETSNVLDICSLNVELSYKYNEAISALLNKAKLRSRDISFIAVHGQTVWHNPVPVIGSAPSTLQLGDPSVISEEFKVKVISNFRVADMAVGGSGAPLVPFANYVLFSSKTKNIAMQNIGGIGNVTYLKKNGKVSDVVAFDTGPGNMMIDEAMRKLYNKEYDESGETAFKGKVHEDIIKDLLKDPYLDMPLPKSTGREKYNVKYLDYIIERVRKNNGTDEDIISTLTAYTADTISYSYNKFLGSIDKVYVSGGGAYNKFLLERLKKDLGCEICVMKDADSLEALSFALLGYYTLKHKPSNVPNVTGASRPVVLGSITDPAIKG